jgi:hypothetical protein
MNRNESIEKSAKSEISIDIGTLKIFSHNNVPNVDEERIEHELSVRSCFTVIDHTVDEIQGWGFLGAYHSTVRTELESAIKTGDRVFIDFFNQQFVEIHKFRK